MTETSKHLVIIYHTQTGNTEAMATAAYEGARSAEAALTVTMLRAKDAGTEDLVDADGVILATPENFGYMSGALKDFFDRTFYPAQGRCEGLPYCLLVSAGNDGSGAVRAVRRIVKGYPFNEVMEPVVCQGPVTDDVLVECREIGAAFVTALEVGIF